MNIKKCPFCGGKAEEEMLVETELFATKHDYYFSIKCTRCGIQNKRYKKAGNAIRAWNKRVE